MLKVFSVDYQTFMERMQEHLPTSTHRKNFPTAFDFGVPVCMYLCNNTRHNRIEDVIY